MQNIVLSAHAHAVCVGKGHRHHMLIMQIQGAHGVCALRALINNIIHKYRQFQVQSS